MKKQGKHYTPGTLTYTYDLSGNVASVVSSNASGTNVSYAWDADNRLSSVTDNRTTGVTNYGYDATSQLASMQYPNGVIHNYTYNNRDRLTNLGINTGTSVLAAYTQTFSDSGRKLTAAEANGRTPSYGYDSIYRLLSETISGDPTGANNGALSYVLDPVGNRSSLTSTLAALPSQAFTYDADDRISADTFDANGNTLTSGGVTYTYDFEDRLVLTSTGVTIVYDGDGNRTSETASGVTTKYLVDDLTPTGYAQVTEELVSGAVVAQFTYGPMRISQNRAGIVSYYGYDAGGSTRQILNVSGAVTDTYAYDAYGNTVARTGSTANDFQYRGEQFDAPIGMYDLRARDYDPTTGRFLTEDKYEGRIRIPLTLNKFVYGIADPVDNADPSGNEVVITYGLDTNNEGTGAAIAGATSAAHEACGLGIYLSLVNVVSKGSWATLINNPIISACNPFPPTLKRMKPPGDCTDAEYLPLRAAVEGACHANSDFGQTPCQRGDSKATCAVKATNLSACIEARVIRESACFRGGDQGHRIWIAKLIGELDFCWEAWREGK